MILGPLLLAGLAAQDVSTQVTALQQAGRYREALVAVADLPQGVERSLHRARCLWAAGDLGGALIAAEEGLRHGGEAIPRRQLLWVAIDLSLELGLAAGAERWLEDLCSSISSDSSLSITDRDLWTDGWGAGTGTTAARARVAGAVELVDAAERAEARSRLACLLAALLAVGAMAFISRR